MKPKKQELCKMCEQPCGNAHKCVICDCFVHLICGEPQGDEEGYGQPVVCFICKPKSKNKMDQTGKAKGRNILDPIISLDILSSQFSES